MENLSSPPAIWGLPPLDAHKIVSSGARYRGVLPVTPGEDFLLLGSHFDLEGDGGFLLDALPPLVLLTGDQQCSSMRWGVQRLLGEMREPQIGGTLVAQQVAYTLLIDALRLHQGQSNHSPGWFAALAEPQIRTALACMHERPAHAWTLEELARVAGLSRTAFAQNFKRVVGETPFAYLTRWRMTVATHQTKREGADFERSSAPYRIPVPERVFVPLSKSFQARLQRSLWLHKRFNLLDPCFEARCRRRRLLATRPMYED